MCNVLCANCTVLYNFHSAITEKDGTTEKDGMLSEACRKYNSD